jgi:predicted Zn-dependent protease
MWPIAWFGIITTSLTLALAWGLLALPIVESQLEIRGGRKREAEADKLGMVLAAKAGFDGNAAAVVWQRVDEEYGAFSTLVRLPSNTLTFGITRVGSYTET